MENTMTLNIDALKAKLNKMNRAGTNSSSELLWKPTEGKHIIRLLPWKGDPTNPFLELQFHYLGNKTQISPQSYGREDPIAEFGESLRGTGSKEEYAAAKQFLPSIRYYAPVIVRGEEDKGVRMYAFSKTVYKQFLSFITDDEIGDIVSVATGRDLTLEYVPKEKSDTSYAKTTLLYRPSSSPLSKDKEQVKKWLTNQPDISDIYPEPTYQELKEFLGKYLAASVSESDPVPIKESAPDAETPNKALSDSMAEFDSLFETANAE